MLRIVGVLRMSLVEITCPFCSSHSNLPFDFFSFNDFTYNHSFALKSRKVVGGLKHSRIISNSRIFM